MLLFPPLKHMRTERNCTRELKLLPHCLSFSAAWETPALDGPTVCLLFPVRRLLRVTREHHRRRLTDGTQPSSQHDRYHGALPASSLSHSVQGPSQMFSSNFRPSLFPHILTRELTFHFTDKIGATRNLQMHLFSCPFPSVTLSLLLAKPVSSQTLWISFRSASPTSSQPLPLCSYIPTTQRLHC